MNSTPQVFNRKLLRKQRNAAAASFAKFAFLKNYLAEIISDRLYDINRNFETALDLGCHTAETTERIANKCKTIVVMDSSRQMVSKANHELGIVADEEYIPFGENIFDAVISAGSLHSVNDLPGTLLQILYSLKPDGLFLATLFGGETLFELRESFRLAELEIEGGLSPRIFPFIDIREAGSLLQRAGFKLPVVDSDKLNVTYPDAFALMRDLKGMAENNILYKRKKNISRKETFARMAEIYQEKFSDNEGRITASFEIVTITGWKQHKSQQEPAAIGSGKIKLKDVLN